MISLVLKNHDSFHYFGKQVEGKLSIIEDPEAKRRIIAMVDYFSQWILKPIHEGCLKLLTHFPCDRTFTQNPQHD